MSLRKLAAAAMDRIIQAPRRLTDAELDAQQSGYHDFNAIESMAVELRQRRAAERDSIVALRSQGRVG